MGRGNIFKIYMFGCAAKPHLPFRESNFTRVSILPMLINADLYVLYERSHLAINSIIKMNDLSLYTQVWCADFIQEFLCVRVLGFKMHSFINCLAIASNFDVMNEIELYNIE